MEEAWLICRLLRRVHGSRWRIAELAAGSAAMLLMNFAFDYLLYPFVIYRFGILTGGVVMTFLSCLACLITLRAYDWSKRDWLGIEAIKRLKEYEGYGQLGRVTAWVLRKSDLAVFFFLSMKYDLFITTVYLRKGAFNGMGRREAGVFSASLIFANAYWIVACYTGISLVEWGGRFIKNAL